MPEQSMPKAERYLRVLNEIEGHVHPEKEGELVRTLRHSLTEANQGRTLNKPTLEYLWNKISKSACWRDKYGVMVRDLIEYCRDVNPRVLID
jgi:hypothetical protein